VKSLTRCADLVWSLWCVVCEEVREEWRVFSQARNTRLKRNPHLRTRLTQNQINQLKQQRRKISDGSQAIALLRDADASGLDLSDFAWTEEDFTKCDLRGANLSSCGFNGARFEGAELWNTDLSDSDLTAAKKLLPAQLAATDLKRAKLPEALTKFEALEASAKLADNASKVFLTILGAVAFIFLTLATTTDVQLFANSTNTKLPVIGTDVAIRNFYWAIPIVLLALFIYFHIYLQRLWEALAALPAVFPDGRRLDEKSHPWLLTDLVRRHLPRLQKKAVALSRLQSVVSMILGYWIVPVTLAFISWRLLPLHNRWVIGYYQAAMLAFAVGLALCFLRNRRETFKDRPRKVGRMPHFSRWLNVGQGIPAAIVVGLLFCSVTFCLDVPASLENAELNDANLRSANLVHADLWKAHLEGADLRSADLRNAYLVAAHLENARLNDAHLEGADLTNAELNDAHLNYAYLESAHLEGANLKGANLRSAHLEGAHLNRARLYKADLRSAHLEGANLEGADLEGAKVNDLNQLKDTVGAYKGSVLVVESKHEK
jgi:uncharacterized protein YjbI with pentapeptide repeats